MIVKTLLVGPIQTNCYVVGCEKTKEGMVIDPGGSEEVILREIEQLGLTIKYVINTHGHFDHTLADEAIVKATGAPLAIHPADVPLLHDGGGARFFGFNAPSIEADMSLEDGDILKVGELTFEVIHTPGHSPGGVSLYNEDEGVIFSGDTLFCMGIGRYDLPGGDFRILMASIRDKILSLPPHTVVYPGHGPATTVGRERQSNPFLL